jgi:hypothetical protein
MEIFEINIGGEVYVSMDSDYEGMINTTILEPNLYGKNLFLGREFFHRFTENGPEQITKEEMQKILIQHKEV